MYYLDTSAAVKLVVQERESAALRAWLGDREDQVFGSDLLRVELFRVTRRLVPDAMGMARLLLDSLLLLALTPAIMDRAARLDPITLKSLDAIHIAAALELGDSLRGMLCYDRAMAEAAGQLGIAVVAP